MKTQFQGEKLWSDQAEEDSEEGPIPGIKQSDEEIGEAKVDEEDQSVNGKSISVKNAENQEALAITVTATSKQQNIEEVSNKADQVVEKMATTDVDGISIDPGGTGQLVSVDTVGESSPKPVVHQVAEVQEVLTVLGQKEKAESDIKLQESAGNTVSSLAQLQAVNLQNP